MMHTMRYSKEHKVWTVGYYAPDYEWIAISDHSAEFIDAAKAEVSYLNGGPSLEMGENAARMADALEKLADCVLGSGSDSEFIARTSQS